MITSRITEGEPVTYDLSEYTVDVPLRTYHRRRAILAEQLLLHLKTLILLGDAEVLPGVYETYGAADDATYELISNECRVLLQALVETHDQSDIIPRETRIATIFKQISEQVRFLPEYPAGARFSLPDAP